MVFCSTIQKRPIRKQLIFYRYYLSIIILISTIGLSSLALANTPLNSSNWQGTTGAQYWIIRDPGTYYLDVPSPFVTNHSFAIWLKTSDITLDGKGITISGAAVPSPVGGEPPPEATSNKYGVRANAGIPSSGIQVKNLKVENKYFGIIFEAVTAGTIEDVTTNNNYHGIYLWDTDFNTLAGNISSENLHSGIVFDANETENNYNTIINNTTNNNAQFGVLLWLECPSTTITGCIANNNGNMGISITHTSKYEGHNILTENTANNNGNSFQDGNGIHFNNVTSNDIIGNTLSGNTHVGLWLKSSSANNVSDNQATENKTGGIWLASSHTNSLVNNVCDNNLGHGIALSDSSYSNTLSGNSTSGNSQAGIVLSSESSFNSITNNASTGNTYGINVINSVQNEITESTFVENTGSGVVLEASNENNVSNNQITGNTISGISLRSSSTNSLTNNICDNNLGHGIALSGCSNSNTLSGNSTSNNVDVGVMLQSEANYNILQNHTANNNSNGIRLLDSNNTTVTNSTLNENDNNGLWVESLSETSIMNNDITSNESNGLYIKSSTNNTISNNNITSNAIWGILLNNSSDQIVFNNNFNNPRGNAGFINLCSNNTWSTQKTLENNIIGGPYLGGNFWGKPDRTGFSQITDDNDKDGICDLDYIIYSDNVDELPLHTHLTVTVSYVNPNDNTCANNNPCYTIIQDAINEASSGMTIKIAQGSYNENVVLNESKDISIEGGWNPTFVSQTPNTTSIKSPIVSKGSITFRELRIL